MQQGAPEGQRWASRGHGPPAAVGLRGHGVGLPWLWAVGFLWPWAVGLLWPWEVGLPRRWVSVAVGLLPKSEGMQTRVSRRLRAVTPVEGQNFGAQARFQTPIPWIEESPGLPGVRAPPAQRYRNYML